MEKQEEERGHQWLISASQLPAKSVDRVEVPCHMLGTEPGWGQSGGKWPSFLKVRKRWSSAINHYPCIAQASLRPGGRCAGLCSGRAGGGEFLGRSQVPLQGFHLPSQSPLPSLPLVVIKC